jgi:spore maturation protein CgeB
MRIAFFGSSLVSAYWNGAATYYRGLVRALARRGHQVTFYEPDAFERQAHRDIPDPEWARVVVYSASGTDGVERALDEARSSADLLVKASGVGVFDELLEAAVLDVRKSGQRVVFWDVDAPATLERVRRDPSDPFRALVGRYDAVFTYGGGPPVVAAYEALGARSCHPIYNALDPDTHYPVGADSRFSGTLGLMANRLPDREERIAAFFFAAARALPDHQLVLGGSGWDERELPTNVRYVGHVYTRDHNAFNCTPRAVLNVNRDSMARTGYSPPTRVFEAAGAGACLVTDAWPGLEQFLEPGREILVAEDADDIVAQLLHLSMPEALGIGEAARRRVLSEHTYAHRAEQLERILEGTSPRPSFGSRPLAAGAAAS